MSEQNKPETAGKTRPVRVPLGTRNVLTAPKRKGYVRRFVNIEPGRIEQFEAAGYTVVKENVQVGDPKIGKNLRPGSGVSLPVGGGTSTVLMEIKEEYYKEDQKAKQDKILLSESDMKRQLNSGQNGLRATSVTGLGPEDVI